MKEIFQKFQRGYPRSSEILRFLIVGCIATVIDMFVMAAVIFLPNHSIYGNSIISFFISSGMAPTKWVVIGTIIGFLVGLIINYVLSYKFVYVGENKKAKTKKGFILFLVLSAFGLLIQTFGMYIGYDILKFNEWIVKIFLVLIVLTFNYITRKIFIFNDNVQLVSEQIEFSDQEKKKIERFIIICLFFIYFVVSYVFLYFLQVPKQGFIFNADHFRVFSDWNVFHENHYRTKVHPLYVLFIYPIFSIIKALGSDAYFACVIFCSVVSTLNSILIYKIIGKITGKPYSFITIFTSIMFAFSFAVFDNTLKTESFAVGCLTLLVFWYWFVCNYNKKLIWKDYLILIVLGVLTFSMTLTNFAQFCIGLLFLFLFKKFNSFKDFCKSFGIMILVLICTILLTWILIYIQGLIFVTSEDAIKYTFDIILDFVRGTSESEEFLYMGESGVIDGLRNIFIFYFGYAFLGGNILAPGNYLHMEPTIFTYVVAFCNFILFLYGIYKIIRKKRIVYLSFLLSFVFECFLHCIYGNATIMLYLLHGIFVIPIVISAAFDGNNKIEKYLWYIFVGLIFISIIQTVFNVFTMFKYIYSMYKLSGRNVILNNIKILIFIPFVIILFFFSKRFFNNFREVFVKFGLRGQNLLFGVLSFVMALMLLLCSIIDVLNIKRQYKLDNAPPTLILMGIGQRNKFYIEKTNKYYTFYSYDVENKISEVLLSEIVDIKFKVDDDFVIECKDKEKNIFYIRETEDSLHYEKENQITILDERDVVIPEFDGKSKKKYLKYSFYESMVNCLEGGFCLNYLYNPQLNDDIIGKMGMVLEKTGNQKELDYNIDENNINSYGQTLYLLWLKEETDSVQYNNILNKAKNEIKNGLLRGSVYETIWLRYALDKANIDADWCVVDGEYSTEIDYTWFYNPKLPAVYSDNVINVQARLFNFNKSWYPYLDIAKLHYFGKKIQISEKLKYPLSFEFNSDIDQKFCNKLTLSSRTSSELFLYLLDYDNFES